MSIIEGKNITYSYGYGGGPALDEVSVSIQPGQLTAILGHNGGGKSTLAKHFNALLRIQQGELTIAGINAAAETEVWRLRRKVGMVFQNPDNQFVSSVVWEDVAFGLENYQVPRKEISAKVSAALKTVGLAGFENRAPYTLSGGQKQRLALAGVLALEPDILVFDEATAMLDPSGRREVMELILRLRGCGKTVVSITHLVEEAVPADQVILVGGGHIIATGSPQEILTKPDLLRRVGLLPPLAVRMYHDLAERGFILPYCPLTSRELAEELCRSQ